MTDNDEHVWRDEARLPLRDLERAMGAPASDGEVDDATGGEAGAEAIFGNGAEPDGPNPSVDERADGDPTRGREMTDNQRRYRPSTTGRTGPN